MGSPVLGPADLEHAPQAVVCKDCVRRATGSTTGNGAPASIQRAIRARSSPEGFGPEGGMSSSTPTRSQRYDASGWPGTT